MKPYKIHNVWVDLDHIVAVGYRLSRQWGFTGFHICASFMFRSTDKEILLVFPEANSKEEALSIFLSEYYEPFLEAWKNKDKS